MSLRRDADRRPSPPSSELEERIVQAAARREAEVRARGLEAWRVVHGPDDGAPSGLAVDRYGPHLVVTAREAIPEPLRLAWCQAAWDALKPTAVVLKVLHPDPRLSRSDTVHGPRPVDPVLVREGDAVIGCDLDDGLPTGLYLDLRELRFEVRPWAQGVEVLNLFAFTGAFSVHAALGGATRVTTVDSARRALGRARENMRWSGLDPDLHRWFPDDVLDHLGRSARRGDRYGLVVADPPAFGRAGRRRFALESDLEALVGGCVGVVGPGGRLVLSVHTAAIDGPRLRSAVALAARAHGRRVVESSRRGLPAWDHPTAEAPPDDRGDYLRVLVTRLD